ncbi:peptidoglycan recognition protein family protein [Clostridium sp.]|uniref:peptidoglycan recognition protein family protein n=1 Tax=Clostridium sp. TaxID=1506 RepID=UPI003D6D6C45
MAITKPSMVTRSQWGAVAPKSSMTSIGGVNKILVHHTAGNSGATGSTAYAAVRSIQKNHMDSPKNYSDIGYHFLISHDGLIFEGRSISYQGAHCAPNGGNINSIGVSLIGNFTSTYISTAQENSLIKLLAWIKTTYSVSYAYIKGHRDYEANECPGTKVYNNLENIRNKVAAYVLGITPL